MSGTSAAPPGSSSLPGAALGAASPGGPRHRLASFRRALRVTWVPAAGFRALRAVIVIPTLFAIASRVLDNPQVALFATFGGFATVVFAGSFGGRTRDKLAAHTALAVGGSILIVIGTAVAGHPLMAPLVTVPVAFCVLITGAAGTNAAVGASAALVAYVLPAASPGAVAMVPDRLAGWWMASVLATALAVLLVPRRVTNRLQLAAADSASTLAAATSSALAGSPSSRSVDEVSGADKALVDAFATAPYRPTGLAVADQALARLVEMLQWCASLVVGLLLEQPDLSKASPEDRSLLAASAGALATSAEALRGTADPPDTAALPQAPPFDTVWGHLVDSDGRGTAAAVHVAFHARLLLVAVRALASDVRFVVRRTGRRLRAPVVAPETGPAGDGGEWLSPLAFALRIVRGNASIRSVWAQNAVRGAVALAAAVAIADNTGVQHGFWVVLGALSVLRTSATSTGANAWRAVVGTLVGFFVGAGLIVGIGVEPAALWATFVLAVVVAAYTPGTAPFAVGQAAFTVVLVVLYNILEPAGWKVGVYRLEDVAIGAGVSVLIGVLLWPRGATKVAGKDLADALEQDGADLVESTAWAVGLRETPPNDEAARIASGRLDDAVRTALVERGTVGRDDVWKLVGGSARLRLLAASLTATAPPSFPGTDARQSLLEESVALAGRCERLAEKVGAVRASVLAELADLAPSEEPVRSLPAAMWVGHHLLHAGRVLSDMEDPARSFAAFRLRPWWR